VYVILQEAIHVLQDVKHVQSVVVAIDCGQDSTAIGAALQERGLQELIERKH
jgi:hypothetical protein